MKKRLWILMGLVFALAPVLAFAVDGQVLINQSTVMTAGGFPYNITQPGSYKLSGNLAVPVGTDAIHIAASNVTLDLNGFSITSADAMTQVFSTGVAGVGNPSGITIRNGKIRGFDNPIGSFGQFSILEDLVLESVFAGGTGSVFGPNARIWHVHFESNLDISLICPSIAAESTARSLFVSPFSSSTGCALVNNSTVVQ